MRKGKKKKDNVLIVLNMTPVTREKWKITPTGKKPRGKLSLIVITKNSGVGAIMMTQQVTTTLVDKKNK